MKKLAATVALLILAIVGKIALVPPALPSLPGRTSVGSPIITANGEYAAAEASDGSYVSSMIPNHRISISRTMRAAIEQTGNYVVLPLLAVHNPKLSDASASASADAVTALMNGGDLKIYNGSQAATADTAVGSQTLCATLIFANPAFGSASAGVATANTITSDTDADNDCTPATWFRILKSDHSTKVMDGAIGTSGSDLNMVAVNISQHQTVGASVFVYTAGH